LLVEEEARILVCVHCNISIINAIISRWQFNETNSILELDF
jgi:hypothetical protein